MFPYFDIFGERVFSYPLLMGAAWGLSFHFYQYLINKHKVDFKHSKLFFTGVFITSWVGAKIFFLITSQGIDSKLVIQNSNFWLGGGFVFYGGLVFGLIFTVIYRLITKNPWSNFKVLIPPLAFGHGVGRIGCFLAGCCFGRPWFKYGEHDHVFNYPTQLIEALGLFIISFVSVKYLEKGKDVIAFYIISYSVLRFCLEFYRGDLIRGIWAFGLSTSQIISITLSVVSILILLAQSRKSATSDKVQ